MLKFNDVGRTGAIIDEDPDPEPELEDCCCAAVIPIVGFIEFNA